MLGANKPSAKKGIAHIATLELVQARPWSTVLRIGTAEGDIYAKMTAGFAAHEAALTAYLHNGLPEVTPDVIAVHPSEPWLLLRDAGQRLREVLIATPDMAHWERLLPSYAVVQQFTGSARDYLLATGLPDRSPRQLPALFDALTADTGRFVFAGEDTLSTTEYTQLRALVPVVRQIAGELDNSPIPAAVNHGDLHDGNIFITATGYAFYDWGDASWSHPFFSMRTAYVSAEIRFNLEEDAPELNRLRNAYLSAWGDYAPITALQAEFALSKRLWAVGSMLSWSQAIAASTNPTEYAHVLPSLARELMAANPDMS